MESSGPKQDNLMLDHTRKLVKKAPQVACCLQILMRKTLQRIPQSSRRYMQLLQPDQAARDSRHPGWM